MRMAGKTAIVTGAGSGMGRASALLFSRHGANVCVADLNADAGAETVSLIAQSGGQAFFHATNVAKRDDVEAMVSATTAKFGRVDVLYNNAGYPMLPTPIEDVDESLWDTIMGVNVKGVFWGAQCVLPVMRQQGSGSIINTASISGVRPRPGQSAYSTSKGAVILLTKALAIEFAPYGIRVNCINPTATETPMLPKLGASKDATAAIVASIPLGRMARPEDIAYAALYLASDESDMVTGTSLDVDGGRGI